MCGWKFVICQSESQGHDRSKTARWMAAIKYCFHNAVLDGFVIYLLQEKTGSIGCFSTTVRRMIGNHDTIWSLSQLASGDVRASSGDNVSRWLHDRPTVKRNILSAGHRLCLFRLSRWFSTGWSLLNVHCSISTSWPAVRLPHKTLPFVTGNSEWNQRTVDRRQGQRVSCIDQRQSCWLRLRLYRVQKGSAWQPQITNYGSFRISRTAMRPGRLEVLFTVDL